MLLEHQYHLHCETHAITDVPYSYANGFEDRTLQTRVHTPSVTFVKVMSHTTRHRLMR